MSRFSHFLVYVRSRPPYTRTDASIRPFYAHVTGEGGEGSWGCNVQPQDASLAPQQYISTAAVYDREPGEVAFAPLPPAQAARRSRHVGGRRKQHLTKLETRRRLSASDVQRRWKPLRPSAPSHGKVSGVGTWNGGSDGLTSAVRVQIPSASSKPLDRSSSAAPSAHPALASPAWRPSSKLGTALTEQACSARDGPWTVRRSAHSSIEPSSCGRGRT